MGKGYLSWILPSVNLVVIIIEAVITHGYLNSCLCPLLCQLDCSKFN